MINGMQGRRKSSGVMEIGKRKRECKIRFSHLPAVYHTYRYIDGGVDFNVLNCSIIETMTVYLYMYMNVCKTRVRNLWRRQDGNLSYTDVWEVLWASSISSWPSNWMELHISRDGKRSYLLVFSHKLVRHIYTPRL